MALTEQYVRLLHTDPETLEGAPTNQEIIDRDADLRRDLRRPITSAERQGFLEMWHLGFIRESMGFLGVDQLNDLKADIAKELWDIPHLPGEIDDLRLLGGIAATVVAKD